MKKQEEIETLEASFLVAIDDCVRAPQRASPIRQKASIRPGWFGVCCVLYPSLHGLQLAWLFCCHLYAI